MILNHLPISAYIDLMKFDMKIFVNVVRLEIGLFLLKARGGASVYFGHISSSIIILKSPSSKKILFAASCRVNVN